MSRLAKALVLAASLLAWPAPVLADPGTTRPATSQPATSQPAATQPATSQPTATQPTATQPTTTPTRCTFVRPKPLTPTTVPYPAAAPAHRREVIVRVRLLVGVDGAVTKVTRLTPPQPPFDGAVSRAAKRFRFTPARADCKPVAVRITLTQRFAPPPPKVHIQRDPRRSVLSGRLRELGTRRPIGAATISVSAGKRRYTTLSDSQGRFRLRVPSGALQIGVRSISHVHFLQQEKLAADQELRVIYFMTPLRRDPYHTVVHGERSRVVTRIPLRGRELRQIPGTFGDPFRVLQTMPGTASIMSLLAYPVVRGTTPASTGFLLDGVHIPLLFHLLAGPSVLHPEFIEQVDFYPGGAPAVFGGYVGGIVNGRTRRPRAGERLVDVDLNFAQAGAFVRWPIPSWNLSVTAAGRYGYPGLLLSLATDEISLTYWDYQLRVDIGDKRRGFTIFVYGAQDALSSEQRGDDGARRLEETLTLHFHRIDLRAFTRWRQTRGQLRVVLGYDESFAEQGDVSSFLVQPSARLSWRRSERLRLAFGVDGRFRTYSPGELTSPGSGELDLSSLLGQLDQLYVGALFAEASWRPLPRLILRAGIRSDVYHDTYTTRGGVDPRLTVRYRALQFAPQGHQRGADTSALWVKAAVGLYHQPPRYVLPSPGLDVMPLRYGLLRALQTSLGVELPLPLGATLRVEGYFSYLDPTLFDLTFDGGVDGDVFELDPNDYIERLTTPGVGRAYGVEVMLRRRSKSGLYGWISYTLSRSERQRGDHYEAYDFDRTHLLNVVVGLPLPRSWSVGLRFQYQSGRPVRDSEGRRDRGRGYGRIDLRIDKRALWRGWLLDFYVDLLNAALLPEEIDADEPIRYIIPTVGLRARF
jgi:TonB family protein